MIALLDVTVLVALAWPDHIYHLSARTWFRKQRRFGWATCPTTENGFIRVSSKAKVIPEAKSPREAALFLKDLTAIKGHVFWSEESSIADDHWISLEKIHTYRQITDAHLLSLALRHEGRLATFDRSILHLVPKTIKTENAIEVISSI